LPSFSVRLPWNGARSWLKIEPFREWVASRYGEGEAFLPRFDALITLAMPCAADRGDISLGLAPRSPARTAGDDQIARISDPWEFAKVFSSSNSGLD
jgi:hypothetical protein